MPPLRDNEEIVTEADGSHSLRYTITLDFGPFVRAMEQVAKAWTWTLNQRRIERAFREAVERGQILSLPPGPPSPWLLRYEAESGRRAIEGISNPLPIGGVDSDIPYPRFRPEGERHE